MRLLLRLTALEFKLMLRDVSPPLFTILLPIALLGFGLASDLRETDEALGGHRGVDTLVPSMAIMVSAAMIAFFMLPIVLATYRERGILRRLAVTPVRPAALLGAQLLMNAVMAFVGVLFVLVIGVTALDMHMPDLPLFLPTFAFGLVSLFSVGLLVAALAPTAKAATGYALGLWFPSAFFGGLYVPVEYVPWIKAIGDWTPLGAFRQSTQAAWVGDQPQLPHLAVLLVTVAVAATVAVRRFRIG